MSGWRCATHTVWLRPRAGQSQVLVVRGEAGIGIRKTALLDDPAGQGIEAVRQIRDGIKRRVEQMLAELSVTTGT